MSLCQPMGSLELYEKGVLAKQQGLGPQPQPSQPKKKPERRDGWLGFNGILSTQVAAISCLKKFKVC